MPWTPKQNRLFRAIEHGWEPPASSGIHIPRDTATKMAHEGVIGQDGQEQPNDAKKRGQAKALRAMGGS